MRVLFDIDGYPTEEVLKEIEVWDFSKGSIDDFLCLVEDLWSYKDRFVLKGKHVLRLYLSTGGWSGNESIIGAMQANLGFWFCGWEKSRRGGHYWFRIKRKLFNKGD